MSHVILELSSQSDMIMLGGCLPETANKRICQIVGLKSGCSPLRNLNGVAYERALDYNI